MKKFLLLVLVLGLVACDAIFPYNPDDFPRNPIGQVTRHGYREAVESWLRAPIEEVIANWGKPHRITPATESNSLMKYEWYRIETHREPLKEVCTSGGAGYANDKCEWVEEEETYTCMTGLNVHSIGDTIVVSVDPERFIDDCEKMPIPPSRPKSKWPNQP
jgi:hypothetical protein